MTQPANAAVTQAEITKPSQTRTPTMRIIGLDHNGEVAAQRIAITDSAKEEIDYHNQRIKLARKRRRLSMKAGVFALGAGAMNLLLRLPSSMQNEAAKHTLNHSAIAAFSFAAVFSLTGGVFNIIKAYHYSRIEDVRSRAAGGLSLF